MSAGSSSATITEAHPASISFTDEAVAVDSHAANGHEKAAGRYLA